MLGISYNFWIVTYESLALHYSFPDNPIKENQQQQQQGPCRNPKKHRIEEKRTARTRTFEMHIGEKNERRKNAEKDKCNATAAMPFPFHNGIKVFNASTKLNMWQIIGNSSFLPTNHISLI